MKIRIPILGAMMASVIALAPMASPALATENAAGSYRAVRDYTIEKKKDFVAWYTRRMTALEEHYHKAAASLKTEGAAARHTWKVIEEDIARKRKTAARKLSAARNATAATWDKAKREADDALADLRKSYENALRHTETRR